MLYGLSGSGFHTWYDIDRFILSINKARSLIRAAVPVFVYLPIIVAEAVAGCEAAAVIGASRAAAEVAAVIGAS